METPPVSEGAQPCQDVDFRHPSPRTQRVVTVMATLGSKSATMIKLMNHTAQT